MYDWPEVREATDGFWAGIAAHLRAAGVKAPAVLDRGRPETAVWRDPDLLLGQACGLPFATGMTGAALYVATPHYDVPGCRDAKYCSLIVARKDAEPRKLVTRADLRVAFNSRLSLSGCLALAAWLAGEGTPASAADGWLETGSHRGSLMAVASGRADLAAIDAVAFALATDHLPEATAACRIVAESRRFPGLPLITAEANRRHLATVRDALAAAFADPATEPARRKLHVSGLSVLPDGAYDMVGEHARRLAALGWACAA